MKEIKRAELRGERWDDDIVDEISPDFVANLLTKSKLSCEIKETVNSSFTLNRKNI